MRVPDPKFTYTRCLYFFIAMETLPRTGYVPRAAAYGLVGISDSLGHVLLTMHSHGKAQALPGRLRPAAGAEVAPGEGARAPRCAVPQPLTAAAKHADTAFAFGLFW